MVVEGAPEPAGTVARKSTARPFVVNLAMLVCLYWWTIALLNLWWRVIALWLPLPTEGGTTSTSYLLRSQRTHIASEIVVFPIFVVLTWILRRQFAAEPDTRNLRARAWLLYFTMLLTGLTAASGLVDLLAKFLNDGIVARALLESLSTVVVAAVAFGYCLGEVRGTWDSRRGAWVATMVGMTALVIGSVAIGLVRNAPL